MFGWIKNNAIMVLVSALASMVAAASFLFVMWRGAEHDASEAKAMAREASQIIAAQTRISENETRVDRVTVDVIQRTLEAPHANELVPPELADAWLDGIDSLRNGQAGPDTRHDDVSRPDGDNAKPRKPDVGGNSSHVAKARVSFSEM